MISNQADAVGQRVKTGSSYPGTKHWFWLMMTMKNTIAPLV
jgi:hypothetical protein